MRNRHSSALGLLSALTGVFLTLSGWAAPPVPPGPFKAPAPASSPEAPAEDDILGPRSPVEIPVPEEFPWGLWLGIGGGVLAAGFLFWWWRHRKGRRIEIEPAERALTQLGAIDATRNALDSAVLADQSADVVRKFVAERFGVAAPRRTTEEFLHELAANAASPLAAHSPLLRGFLKSCDMAKFAGTAFDAAERVTLLDTARRFIRTSNTPVPELPQPPPVKSEAV